MAEITFTRSEITRLLAASFTKQQLTDARDTTCDWTKPQADMLSPYAYPHWFGILNDAALGDVVTDLRDDK